MSATVRLCPVDPAADADEIITAAVSLITTTYTAPGDRIMLADTETPATGASRTRRDRLVESVLRLGRSATTAPDYRSHLDHESAAAGGGPPSTSVSGSGLGHQSGDPVKWVANPTNYQDRGEPSGPGSDGFTLIIAGWSDHPADPFAMADWAPALTPAGTVVVLTHSSDQHRSRATHLGRLSRAAASAGLILINRLILAHHPSPVPRPATRQSRWEISLGGHRRILTTASVFRHSSPLLEVHHS
ncbi:hypothetical protein MOQ72_21655 [Saccharopolyspora sp. K220]|uniref:hypothetical protein n=1 Tax=Saccharopolyspora soli TaxID=2926618 RepID=UPI001F56DAA9|nr:hypothetical protein [Saccharopolyspora soli]MCI2420051.1 hypothetical protein [Saccharopolyspora soli]